MAAFWKLQKKWQCRFSAPSSPGAQGRSLRVRGRDGTENTFGWPAAVTMSEQVKIWSYEHNAWWRAASRGYTTDKSQAGLYDLPEAERIVDGANRHLKPGHLNECIVRAGEEVLPL